MIMKKNDWKKGEYAFTVRAITPDGTVIEYDCPHVKPAARGKEAWYRIRNAVGLVPADRKDAFDE